MKKRFINRIQNFNKDCSGVAALEFGVTLTPLIASILLMIESGYFYMVTGMLQGGVENASRLIKISDNQLSRNQIISEICSEAVAIFGCTQVVFVDVRESGVSGPSVVSNGKFVTANMRVSEVKRGEAFVIRAYARMDSISGLNMFLPGAFIDGKITMNAISIDYKS